MKVSHISYGDGGGGAMRAAYRLHSALLMSGLNSTMHVVEKTTDDPFVFGLDSSSERIISAVRRRVTQSLAVYATRDRSVFRSLAVSGPGLVGRAEATGADVIQMHWVGAEAINLKELSSLTVPLVWRIADMWPFCGAEHYSGIAEDARWRVGYDRSPAPTGVRFDLDRLVWERKRKYIPKNIQLVATTDFVARCVRESALFGGFRVETIPNALDTETYRPLDQGFCREALSLPKDVPLVLFGAVGGVEDPRKGWDLLVPALLRVVREIPGAEGVIFGQRRPEHFEEIGFPLHWMGRVNDDVSLAILYGAADVMVVPSRQETFGQTASEAQACGCPVVAFNSTGLADVVEHMRTGYLAAPYSTEDLAIGISRLISSPDLRAEMAIRARDRACRLWSFPVVANKYQELYERMLGEHDFPQGGSSRLAR